ncbi:MAG: S1 RNA-binding domain-containing protein, partial [Bacteroidota bacterium]
EVIVHSIDLDNRRLSLGHKQLTEDVWETFASIFTVGSTHKGTIKKVDGKGARVELEYGVEGTAPSRHLKVEEGNPELKVDDVAEFVVIEFNKDAKKLILSHSRTWDKKETVEKRKPAPAAKKRTKSSAKPSKQSTTTLGEIDALAKLKMQMEAAEQEAAVEAAKEKLADLQNAEPVNINPNLKEEPKEEAPVEEAFKEEAPKEEVKEEEKKEEKAADE